MEYIIWPILLGIIPASIAKKKGEDFIVWWIYGSLLFIVALPHSILMKANKEAIEKKQVLDGNRKCPYCAEFIKSDALVCKHCNHTSKPITTEEYNSIKNLNVKKSVRFF